MEIKELLEDLKRKGIPIPHVLPATLHLKIYDIDYENNKTCPRIRNQKEGPLIIIDDIDKIDVEA
ncbi:hypothetical protein COL10_24875 [Bacillus cereus]|uniref:hypothetical protein n=1 Tax=Bacillus cereus group TaxID=86661 RepID=UPI000BF328E0|nr:MULTISPECIES: hypothetical protein [Bacillus cereus group]MDF9663782.1 hypothetical protein [Bacillus wiedmannii]PEQ53054.1 hypothetical protein CN468_02635 [Bacillus cereus]PFD68887.1 hypothetical protein CN301_26195 [Bacillus cereus]PFV05433.1 hypothetical protein COL10_24875 [Bacillus cereus]PGV45092.1 hypothetical protein COD74_13065 [Bacillus cereus]